jgi:hypothetical protein
MLENIRGILGIVASLACMGVALTNWRTEQFVIWLIAAEICSILSELIYIGSKIK